MVNIKLKHDVNVASPAKARGRTYFAGDIVPIADVEHRGGEWSFSTSYNIDTAYIFEADDVAEVIVSTDDSHLQMLKQSPFKITVA
jgi:hypothetical protein